MHDSFDGYRFAFGRFAFSLDDSRPAFDNCMLSSVIVAPASDSWLMVLDCLTPQCPLGNNFAHSAVKNINREDGEEGAMGAKKNPSIETLPTAPTL